MGGEKGEGRMRREKYLDRCFSKSLESVHNGGSGCRIGDFEEGDVVDGGGGCGVCQGCLVIFLV